MIFRKKKKMIDIRELQKRGVVRLPESKIEVPTDQEGFVELNKFNETPATETSTSNTEMFGFSNSTPQSSDEVGGYNKQEVDGKITELDNKVYKLEQRIELLERKAGVDQPNEPDNNLIGW
jgi:hypothetical protein